MNMQCERSLQAYAAGWQQGPASALKRQSPAILTRVIFCFLFLAFLLVDGQAQAQTQNKWALTIGPNVNFPGKELGSTTLNTGFGFDATIGYRVMPHLFANAGWGWNRFTSKNTTPASDFEETGYLLGLRFVHPIGHKKVSYIVGAQAVYNHIETENKDGDIVSDSGHGWGWQGEAGLSIPLSGRLQVLPTIRYHALSRDMTIENTSVPADLIYVAAGVGLSWSF